MDYQEKAQKPEEGSVVEEPAATVCATEHVVHVPFDAHGRDVDWAALQTWLAAQAQAFVEQEQQLTPQKLKVHMRPGKCALTDEELEKELEGLPSWDEVEHPDLSDVDYTQVQKALSGRVMVLLPKVELSNNL